MMRILVFVFSMALLFSACNGGDTKEESDGIIRMNIATGLSSLDPAYASNQSKTWMVNQLFKGLVQMNDNLEILPCHAKSWTISDDKTRYRFLLEPETYFHKHELFTNAESDYPSRRVTAEDFVYSFQRIMTTGSGGWIFRDKIASPNQAFSAEGDSVFIIQLKKPFPPLLEMLCMQYCSVVPREAVHKFGENFGRQPIGTGPFQFERWEDAEILLLKKNESYFEKDKEGNALPYAKGVQIEFNNNKTTEFLSLLEGKLDFVSDIEMSLRSKYLNQDGSLSSDLEDKIYMLKHPYFNTEYLNIVNDPNNPIMKGSPLLKKEFRLALNFGFDRVEMIEFLNQGNGFPALGGFIPNSLPSYNPQKSGGYTFNAKRARKLLKEANYNGEEFSVFVDAQYKDLVAFVVKSWTELGINAQLELVKEEFLKSAKRDQKLPMYRSSWIGDYPSGENFMTLFYGKNGVPPNYSRFNNPDFDHFYEKALTELDRSKRLALFQKMDSIVVANAPVVPLYYDEALRFATHNIEGLGINAMNLLDLRFVRFKN